MADNSEITWRDRAAARFMPLAGGASSAAAKAVADDVLTQVVLPSIGSAPRPSSIIKYRTATAALLSDLLRFDAQGRGGKRGMGANDFSSRSHGFAYGIFKRVTDALVEADLLQYKRGWKRVEEGFSPGSEVRSAGDLAFFRPTAKLRDMVHRARAEPYAEHWIAGKPSPAPKASVLELRAKKKDGQERGSLLPIEPDDKLAALYRADMDATNAFLAEGGIEGIAFVGLKRVFNDGDQPSKKWRRGGRYYSLRGGDRYEQMSGELRRSTITMLGEPVAEVDISASHLTILYAVLGLPFDASKADPYEVKGFPRLPVKLWITSSLGRGMAESTRWSPKSGKLYREEYPDRRLSEDFKAAEVRKAVIQRHPLFHELAELGLTALDFQWHESEVLRSAMYDLRAKGIVSLPVHDSLIVPCSNLEDAKEAIKRGFQAHFESEDIYPRLSVKGS